MVNKLKKGFTLIEILLVVAILSILLVVVFAALNPAQRLIDTRNARRWNDVNQLLTAVHECVVDENLATCLGTYTAGNVYEVVFDPTGVTAVPASGCQAVCTTATADTSCLQLDTTLADYIAKIPMDPTTPVAGHSSYSITVGTNGIITVASCGAEDGETISVSR